MPKLKNYEKQPEPIEPIVESNYADLNDEFSELKALNIDERVETEKLSKYLVDSTDIEGKSYLDPGEKMIFTLVSIMAEYPKFAEFRLDRLPKKWLLYAMGEQGRGRQGVLEILKGNVRIGDPKDMQLPGMPNMPTNGRRR